MDAQENDTLTRTGPGTPMGALFRRFWIPALLSEELSGPDCNPGRVTLLGESLIAFRDSDKNVGLLDAHCPHRRAELFFGRNEKGGLRCVYHGWKFNVDGKCLDIPSEPYDTPLRSRVRAPAYPVKEQGGIIWAYLGPKGVQPPLPALDFLSVPVGHCYVSKCLMRCNYQQALEGSMDTAHLSYLHRSFVDVDDPHDALGVGQFLQLSNNDGVPKFFVNDTDYGMRIATRREGDDNHYYWRISQWLMPLCVVVATAPGSICRGNIFVPIDDQSCWWYRMRWHHDQPPTEEEVRGFYKHGDFAELIPGTYRPLGSRENDYLID